MKQLQKHLIIILVMGIMLAAALIGGISTFTFREISSNDNRAIMKSIQQTDMEELNDTLRVTAQTVNALTASYADIVPDDLSLPGRSRIPLRLRRQDGKSWLPSSL